MSDAGQRRRDQPVYEMREPGRNFAIYLPEDAPVVYADGIAGMTGGAAVSNIDFYVIADIAADGDPALGPRETREIRLRVKMPTFQLLEGLANLVSMIEPTGPLVQAAAEEHGRAVASQIQRLRAMNAGASKR
jgi:hypothetical protein